MARGLPLFADAHEDSGVDQLPDDLFHEEGIPFGLLQDDVPAFRGEVGDREQMTDEFFGVRRGELMECNLHVAVREALARQVVEPPAPVFAFGAEQEPQEQRGLLGHLE